MNRITNLQEAAIDYNQRFGMNVIPMIGKVTIDDWKQWQEKEETFDDIMNMNWDGKITGIAGICGVNDLVCIDLDKVTSDKIASHNSANIVASYPFAILPVGSLNFMGRLIISANSLETKGLILIPSINLTKRSPSAKDRLPVPGDIPNVLIIPDRTRTRLPLSRT